VLVDPTWAFAQVLGNLLDSLYLISDGFFNIGPFVPMKGEHYLFLPEREGKLKDRQLFAIINRFKNP
jgi:hypothetical protein